MKPLSLKYLSIGFPYAIIVKSLMSMSINRSFYRSFEFDAGIYKVSDFHTKETTEKIVGMILTITCS